MSRLFHILAAAGNGISVANANRIDVFENDIGAVAGHGIALTGGSTTYQNWIRDNDVDYVGGNGIEASNAKNIEIRANDVGLHGFVGGNGIDVRSSDIVNILDNEVGTYVQNDGIYVNPSSNVLIKNNKVTGVGQNGIHVNGNTDVTIANNIVSNSGAAGLFASGGTNGLIVISGNTFNDNPIGMLIQSGIIDLTGDTNYINGGVTGIMFDRFGGTAPLSMVGTASDIPGTNGTFGTTTFTGQTGSYITLANNAFSLGAGNPIWLDVSYSTFDGFTPDSKPRDGNGVPILTQAEYDYLESMFYHFNDLDTIGLLLFGGVPTIDQEKLLKKFDPTNLQISGLNVTVLGLPQIPGGPASFNNITPFAGGRVASSNPADLNNIATAAGGDDNGAAVASYLNDIDTAAGGQSAGCWGDVVGAAAGGQTVNMSYTSSFEDTLNGAASCGTGI